MNLYPLLTTYLNPGMDIFFGKENPLTIENDFFINHREASIKSLVTKFAFGLVLLLAASNAFAANLSNKNSPDIIAATLYGTEAELRSILALPEDKLIWKTYQGGIVDSRNVALFYALSCGHLQNVPILLKNGAEWSALEDMPYMKEECKKKLNSKHVSQSIIAIEKQWVESEAGGDCARGEHIYDVLSSPKSLELLLTHDRNFCHYKTQCEEPLEEYLKIKDMGEKKYKKFLNVYNKFCN